MKKILVVSDTHGASQALRAILREELDTDALIFLGDGEQDLQAATEANPKLLVYAVRGNCDLGSYLPASGLAAFERVLFFYTHGHLHNAKMTLDELEEDGKKRGADVVLFGHTHQPILKHCEGVTLFNPGSAGQSFSGNDSYGVILVQDGKAEFEHRLVPAF